jgi:N-methylhydantoinase A
VIALANESRWPLVTRCFDEMRTEAGAWLERERVAAADRAFRCFIDARYEGQNFEVIVPLPDGSDSALDLFLRAFAQGHAREYGYELPGKPVEIVNCRLQALGAVPKAPLSELAPSTQTLQSAHLNDRRVHFGAAYGWIDTPVYRRSALGAGSVVLGPAVIEEMSSTIAIAPGRRAEVDRIGNIVVHVREEIAG